MKYQLEQIVYYVTDEQQIPAIICGIVIRPGNVNTYLVGDRFGESECYEFELSDTKKVF